MSILKAVFVFGCSDPNVFGLSLQRGGSNIPNVAGNRPWSFKEVVPLTERDVAPFASDTVIALANLRARGYHIAHKTADLPVRA